MFIHKIKCKDEKVTISYIIALLSSLMHCSPYQTHPLSEHAFLSHYNNCLITVQIKTTAISGLINLIAIILLFKSIWKMLWPFSCSSYNRVRYTKLHFITKMATWLKRVLIKCAWFQPPLSRIYTTDLIQACGKTLVWFIFLPTTTNFTIIQNDKNARTILVSCQKCFCKTIITCWLGLPGLCN